MAFRRLRNRKLPCDIRKAIHDVDGLEPTAEKIHQVAARLASVGWPLAATN